MDTVHINRVPQRKKKYIKCCFIESLISSFRILYSDCKYDSEVNIVKSLTKTMLKLNEQNT